MTAFVFVLLLAAIVLFATEPVPIDVTAIGVTVVLLAVESVMATFVDLDPSLPVSGVDTVRP